jgi:hypothetical protein
VKHVNVKGIEFLLRRNLGNYEHSEIKVVGVVVDGGDASEAAREMKAFAERTLFGTVTAPAGNGSATPSADVKEPSTKEAAPADSGTSQTTSEKQEKSEAAAKAKADKEATAAAKKAEKEAAEKAKAETKASAKVEKYDRTIKDHTSTFAGFLTKTYGDAWKTKPGLKEFSESLSGIDFRDDKGVLVDSFKAKIAEFFGEAGDVL